MTSPNKKENLMTSNESIATQPDFVISMDTVNPSDHKKPKVQKPMFVKVVSKIRINIDGSHEVVSSSVRKCDPPATKLVEPDLVMKRVPRFKADGKVVSYGNVIHVNKSLRRLGITLDDLLSKTTKMGSAEHRLKIAYKHTKTMTPEREDTDINILQSSVGGY